MARKRTSRGLRPEERELWQRVASSARPLHGPGSVLAREFDKAVASGARKGRNSELGDTPRKAPPADAAAPVSPFRIGALAAPGSPSYDLAKDAVGQRGAMDRKAYERLSRGKLRPEGRIDLHGMTLAQAQPALTRFILSAQAAGRRLVLVITGKGRARDDHGPIPRPAGAMRHEVPLWLGRPPLSAAVLQIARAHPRHGGEGAYYVYLRKPGR